MAIKMLKKSTMWYKDTNNLTNQVKKIMKIKFLNKIKKIKKIYKPIRSFFGKRIRENKNKIKIFNQLFRRIGLHNKIILNNWKRRNMKIGTKEKNRLTNKIRKIKASME